MTTLLYTQALGPHHDADGTSYNTSTTLTDVSNGAATNPYFLPGGSFLQEGTMFELDAWGTYATNATTPTLILGFYYGGVAGIALAASTAVAVTNTATINWPWKLHYDGVIQTGGTSGAILGHGYQEIATSLTAVAHREIPETATAQVTIDTTVQKAITVGAQWGTSAAGNILICRFLRIRID